jgi:histone deacetylase 1/2
LCVFLGYSPHHKGYVCFDRHSNRTIISRHVIFDETSFPFATDSSPPPAEAFEFLEDFANPVTVLFPSLSFPAGTNDPLPTASLAPGRAPPSSRSSPSGGPLPPTQQPPLAVSSASLG